MRNIFTAILLAIPLFTVMCTQTPKTVSYLEVYDFTDDSRRVIKEFPFRIEAPNWTPDGEWIVFNSSGRLYRLPASGKGEAEILDYGFADNCNNDHVISSDGRYMAVSHRNREENIPRIYILPIWGGVPKIVTPNGPSWLHGWSSDMKMMTYCAKRDGNMDVWSISVEGGEEIRLTSAEGLDDGPEFSPDDRHIWFNSERSSLMQVWRMNPDGSEQTQMTFDEDLNSWFPHVSPDGKTVVYLSYHKGDLEPGQHLAGKNVQLRVMPYEGGCPRTIVELYGGQGTLNVNSWAPDSKRFAFVSYSKE